MYLRVVIAAFALVCASFLVPATASAAPAGKYYSNCDALKRDFKHGVARSAQAASKQVRAGYGRPATTKRAKAAYKTNSSRLDRDKDGTACES